MRQLQWNKVPPSNVEKTIWNSISNEEAVRAKIDLTEFEEIFAQNKAANSKRVTHIYDF